MMIHCKIFNESILYFPPGVSSFHSLSPIFSFFLFLVDPPSLSLLKVLPRKKLREIGKTKTARGLNINTHTHTPYTHPYTSSSLTLLSSKFQCLTHILHKKPFNGSLNIFCVLCCLASESS